MVPDEWANKKLEQILSLEYGKALTESERQEGSVDVYGSNGIIGVHNKSLLKAPGIVIGRKGTVGSVVWAERDFWAIDTTYYVKLKYEVELRWLYFMLLQIKLEYLTQATGSPGLNRNDVYRQNITIPPLPEQKKIAAILSSVDEAIASTKAVIDQTRKVKQGILQQLLTRGIGHTKFKDSVIGKIPEHWEVVTIGDIADVIDPQPDHRTPPEVFGGIPYVGMGDIKADGSIDFDGARKVSPSVLDKQQSSFTIYPEAFTFGKIGTIGNPSVLPDKIDFALSANLIIITSKDLLMSKYLLIVMQSAIIEKQIQLQTNITSQPALGIKKVRNFLTPLPSRQEIQSLVDNFYNLEDFIKCCLNKLQNLEQIKRGLMQDLLTGRVRV